MCWLGLGDLISKYCTDTYLVSTQNISVSGAESHGYWTTEKQWQEQSHNSKIYESWRYFKYLPLLFGKKMLRNMQSLQLYFPSKFIFFFFLYDLMKWVCMTWKNKSGGVFATSIAVKHFFFKRKKRKEKPQKGWGFKFCHLHYWRCGFGSNVISVSIVDTRN